MDYTPCGFSDNTHLHLTTFGFELVLPVILESGILHYADTPASGSDVHPFMSRRLSVGTLAGRTTSGGQLGILVLPDLTEG